MPGDLEKTDVPIVPGLLRIVPRPILVKNVAVITLRRILDGIAVFFLAQLARELGDVSMVMNNFMGYISAVLFSAFMVIPARYFEVTLYLEAFNVAFDRILGQQAGEVRWIQSSRKSAFTQAIGLHLYQAVSGLASSIRDIFGFFIGFLINAIVFGFVLDPLVGGALLISLCLAMGVHILSRKALREKAEALKSQEVKSFSEVEGAWDHLVLGNPGVSEAYLTRFKHLQQALLRNTQQSYLLSEWVVFLATFLAWVPPVVAYIWVLYSQAFDLQYILPFLVLLPKQASLIEQIRSLSQLLTFFEVDLESYKTIWKAAQIKDGQWTERIKLHQITFNGYQYQSLEDLTETMQSQSSGRWTIRGGNGAGKSTLLAFLKLKLKGAFLLPARAHFYFTVCDRSWTSSGQTMNRQLKTLASRNDPVLLLDEWDANLDDKARAHWDREINEWAKSRIVIEVRHHAG
jgi:ABC-type multidrug transport system fused ATPase/permease subunit